MKPFLCKFVYQRISSFIRLLYQTKLLRMKHLLFIICILLSLKSFSQDVHFTQYYTSPLTLNPANTGLTNNDWRLSANYRSQWGSINSVPYLTGTVSYDMPLLQDKLKGDAIGVGLIGLYDQSGTGALRNTTFGVSLGYHKRIGDNYNRPQTLSIGVQRYFVQKSIDASKLIFEDMINPLTGLPVQPSGDVVNSMEGYADYNAGIMYTGKVSDHTSIYGGVSYYHITNPNESFLGEVYELPSRISATLGGSFEMNENMILYASGAYQQQGKAFEVLAGGAAGFVLNPYHEADMKSTVFYLGAWYRYNDAVSPYVGFEWSRAKVGFSYDVNVSSLAEASQGQGAMEISFIYNGLIQSRERKSYNFDCPKF